MKKKNILLCVAIAMLSLLLTACGGGPKQQGSGSGKQAAADNGKKLVIYTSMKESLIGPIVEGFKKANPGVDVDYQSAGAGDNQFPTYNVTKLKDGPEKKKKLGEEMRLFYVAITRAKKKLVISWPTVTNSGRRTRPSRFIGGLPGKYTKNL